MAGVRMGLAIVLVSGTQLLAQVPATPVGQPLTPVGPQPPAGQTVPFTPAQVPGQPAAGRLPIPGANELPAMPANVDPALMAHLQGWDKVMQSATNFYAKFNLQRKVSKPFPKVTQYSGSMICLKPNLARMRMDIKPAAGQEAGPNDYEAYICSGKAVFHYEGPSQTVTVYPITNGVGENLLIEMMSGQLRATDVVRRFDGKILKQDQHYLYLELLPKLPRDKSEFNSMTLVLFQPTLPGVGYLPRTVVVRKDNGNQEEIWDFPEPATNVQGVKPDAFDYVPPAKGWKVQQMQTPQPATKPAAGGFTPVARPTGPAIPK
jgi:TIGR03009 family protein